MYSRSKNSRLKSSGVQVRSSNKEATCRWVNRQTGSVYDPYWKTAVSF